MGDNTLGFTRAHSSIALSNRHSTPAKAVFPMAPIGVVTGTTNPLNSSKTTDKTESAESPLVMDQNDNFLRKAGEYPWKFPDAVNGRRNLYSNVDKQFLEFMIDAVNRGYVPEEFQEGKTPLSNGVSEQEPREGPDKVEDSRKSGPRIDGHDSADLGGPPAGNSCGHDLELGSPFADKSDGHDSDLGGPNAVNSEGSQAHTRSSPSEMTEEAQNGSPSEESESRGTGLSSDPLSLPSGVPKDKTPFPAPTEDSIKGREVVSSAVCDGVRDENGDEMEDDKDKTPFPAASEDAIEGREAMPSVVCDGERDENDDGEVEDDPFMLYLDSIEHSALKFKVQIERAKIDTLHTLKCKLEEAYEGTPLEEIPSKFREKLQEAIAQLASEDVEQLSGLAENDAGQHDAELVSYLKDELDSVAAENFRLNQQFETLKQYEDSYYEMKDEVQLLNEELVDVRDKYEKKKEESEFLAARVGELEKGIFNMRVEYEDQVREMQEETLNLQMMLAEFQNETDFEDHAHNGYIHENGEVIGEEDEEENMSERGDTEFISLHRELEAMRFRLEESERRNEALKTATAADQSVIKCLEGKVTDLENSLDKSHEDCSRYLSELQDAQRQMSSDRAKLASYHEETEALQRENKLLKSSLEIAENEIAYLQGKGKRTGEPWKDNRKQIWREIRQLEKILKDVHKEKRSIEKKYVTFKHETDVANNSLTSYSLSPPRSPESETTGKAGLHRQVSKDSPPARDDWATGAPPENEIVTPPQKVQSWIEDLDTPTGMERKNSGSSGSVQSPVSHKPLGGCPLSQELQELRSHVGSLEAEKAAIVKELSSLRSSRFGS